MQHCKFLVFYCLQEKKWRSLSLSSSDEEDSSSIQASSDVAREIPQVLKEESGSLSQPEFMGLWNQDYKPYKVIVAEW